MTSAQTPEDRRLVEDASRTKNWKRWGPYLAERQWGTVREDYSPHGTCWDHFPHDQARCRAYRWGEDGLLGWTDRQCRLCFAVALWNERDPILKERLFGLANEEGNHGEDVKEEYFYLDALPTYAYAKALYRYPQERFPYDELIHENRRRDRTQPEFEITDSRVFKENRFFDVTAEYAKSSPNDLLIRIHVTNCGPERRRLHVLPTVWFRNTWTWECAHEGCATRPAIRPAEPGRLVLSHETLGTMRLAYGTSSDGADPASLLLTENESNLQKVYGVPNPTPFVKDAFHDYVIEGRHEAVGLEGSATKAAPYYVLDLEAGASATIPLRLWSEDETPDAVFGAPFDKVFATRKAEADAYYAGRVAANLSADENRVVRQAYAGLLWSHQFYHYIVEDWLTGDPAGPTPPESRMHGRNQDWTHVYCRDVLSMPDKWEYPWFAAWDLAFHMLPLAQIDPEAAKRQLRLLLREWYMHPNGQIPAYEFAFEDVNPPVHAWAAWRVYKIAAPRGRRDRVFLESVFQKLLLNFTWWVNRKDREGKNLFSGGFLGLDNIGVFDRSKPLPTGGYLQQADGTAWMACYCGTMLSIALELARTDDRRESPYEDMASKFFEHFIQITDAMNRHGETGLWDDEDGFYYDQIQTDHEVIVLKIRSMVGLIPLLSVEILDEGLIEKLPGFYKRFQWFLEHRSDLARHISYCERGEGSRLLAIPSKTRLLRVLRYLLDENEFLSPYGIRSLSKYHQWHPFTFDAGGERHRVEYLPGESDSGLFGGNSNWRGPVWFPVNYVLIEALEKYHRFYGESLRVECPTGSGYWCHLGEVAEELERRLISLFLSGDSGDRRCFGDQEGFRRHPLWRDLLPFHEYFHAETGQGLGAKHQTGWTSLVARVIQDAARRRGNSS